MGQQTIMQSMNQSYSLDENEIDRRFQNHLKLKQQLNQGILSQTAVISIKTSLFVLRSFQKSLLTSEEPTLYKAAFLRFNEIQKAILGEHLDNTTSSKHEPLLHVNPILNIIETSSMVFILRQYYYYNLKERMYKLPYLTYTEKLWIIFQLLFAVSELHERNIIHGDIKLENIMLTSNGSLFLTDIASYKPAYIPMDDSTVYTYYFGSAKQSLKTCNLAPERFVEKKDLDASSLKENFLLQKQPEMDIFSLGCVISELILEEYLFDYAKMLEFKNGKVDINVTLSKIQDDKLRMLISRMLELDPAKRINLQECFKEFAEHICPIAIPRALIHFNTLIIKTSYWRPDMIIGSIYKHWRQIWKLCYGEFNEENIPKLYNKYKFTYINKLSIKPDFKNLTNQFNTPTFRNFSFIFDLESQCSKLLNEEEYKTNPHLFKNNHNEKTSILFINYILQNLPFAKYESSKIVGMEMLKCFSNKLTDIEKIQIIIPYFKPMLTVPKYLTRLTALHYLIDILQTINFDMLIVTPLDYKFFYDYISPAIFELVDEKGSTLMIEFLNELENIIDLEQKFRDVEKRSRLEEITKRKSATIERYGSASNTISTYDELTLSNENDIQHQKIMQCATLTVESNLLEKEEVKKVCDGLVKKFKWRLFSVIQNLFNKQEDIEMLQILIRKLPTLLSYYSSEKADEIFCFCINILNKKEWILLKEILNIFPVMLEKFDQNKNYRHDLITCIEMILLQNINEHVIYELIQVLIGLFATKKKSGLSIKTFLPLFNQLIPFQIHPNKRIRDNIISFAIDFISQLTPLETFIHTYNIYKPFLQVPVVCISKDKIQKYIKPHICRTNFELHLNEYESLDILTDEGYIQLLQFLSAAKALSSQMTMPMNNEDDNDNEHRITLSNTVDELYKLYQSYEGIEHDDDDSLRFFLKKILGICEVAHGVEFPKYVTNTDLPFENDMGFGSKDFAGFLIVKKFNISIKLSLLNVMFENQKENEQNTTLAQITHRSYQISEHYSNWRPQGQLISTITQHKHIPIEKLLPMDENSFMSIDSKGDAYLWNITTEDGISYNINQGWKVTKAGFPITFNATISNGDNNKIIFASKHKLIQYSQVDDYEGVPNILITMKNEKNYITSTCTFERSSQEKLSVLFSTIDCKLNIYDPRMEKIALICELPKERGIVSCITNGFDEQNMNIGTLGGYIMQYDARLNTFSSSIKYHNNKPIVGISSYFPQKCKNKTNVVDFKSLIIWTGSDEHDIVLWNTSTNMSNTIIPSIIFRTNILYSNDIDNDMNLIEIPDISKVNDFISTKSNESEMIRLIDDIAKFSWIKYSSYEYRKLIMQTIESDFYERVESSVWNSKNIYNNISTVQSVFSPFVSRSLDNPFYIISAGNDKTIRYWDISEEGLCYDYKKKTNNDIQSIGSYIINAPCVLEGCRFTKTEYEGTIVLQSNEVYNEIEKIKEKQVSEYQNWNGHTAIRNADEEENSFSFLRTADAAHTNIITSILPMSVEMNEDGSGNGYNGSNMKTNLLISSSWDGSIKIWK